MISHKTKLGIAFLGPKGTYSEDAVKKKYGNSIKKNPTTTIQEVFRAVVNNDSNYGIVPIENSTEGPINTTLDCLGTHDILVCGEIEVAIHHNLMGLNKTLPNNDFVIHAHEQSFSQCKSWLDDYCPNAKRVTVISNAQAALNAQKDNKILAIAGKLAANKYGLEIIRTNIEDYSGNTTRFVCVGYEDMDMTGKDKTSIIITTKNVSGALYDVLRPIKENNLNLTHITYRPSKINKWNYSFFLDFEGHKEDLKVKSLLKQLNKIGLELKFLGSYPKGVS